MMNETSTNPQRLWKGPVAVWLALVLLFAVSTASAYVPLGAANTAINLGIAAAMVVLLVLFLMDLRRSSTLLHLLAVGGLFWTTFMFSLTFVDYASRHY